MDSKRFRGRPAAGPSVLPRVLVTGAGGFTGIALTRSLIARGYRVRGLVHTNGAEELRHAGAEVVQGDIRQEAVAAEAVAGIDLVYHLAAVFRRAGVPDSEYRSVHVDATRLLLETSAAAGVGRFVHCSTVGVHGDVARDHPATEDAPFHPGDIYQQTKLEGEWMARETARRVGMPLTVVRPGPIYGPGDRRLYKLIGGVARRRFRLLGDGTPHFQMVYVDDLNEGLRLAGECDQAVGETYIIAGDEAPTLEELVIQIASAADVAPPKLHLPVWPFWVLGAACEAVCVPLGIEPPIFRRRVSFFTNNRWFDTSRARRDLGYTPKVSLRQGLARTLDSYHRLGWI